MKSTVSGRDLTRKEKKMKQLEIKLKYSEARIRALRSSLAKRNKTLESEMMECLEQLYKKNVKPDVREYIEEMEEENTLMAKKPRPVRKPDKENQNI